MSQPKGIDNLIASGVLPIDIPIVHALLPLNPQLPAPERSVIFQRIDEIEAKPIEWLWRGWLARFMLTILGGFGG